MVKKNPGSLDQKCIMSICSPLSHDEVTPEEIAAIERVLQHIDHENAKKQILAPLANWLLVLKLFKELEVRYACMKNRAQIEQAHRAILTTILAGGECFLAMSSQLSDEDLKRIQITPSCLLASVKYLRMKHAQWYSKRDPKAVEAVMVAIETAAAPSA